MITLYSEPCQYRDGKLFSPVGPDARREATMAYSILLAHNQCADSSQLRLKFDAMASHDITYVGIVQTARTAGLTSFPIPYVLTNCHNSLCAVGGTINEDDHLFGLSAAKKYGGEFVPAHLAVIHQYMRECYAGGGKMILASDSHTRYGPYGTLAIGEGGPELVKQLVGRTYDIAPPQVVAVWLEGAPAPGVGPQDVALALIGAVYRQGFVKNKVLEFIGPGIDALSMDFRNGIDVMTTESTCLSSIWRTDNAVLRELTAFGRARDYVPLAPADGALYDASVVVDLSRIEPMIALPFHPSNVYPISQVNRSAKELLNEIARAAKEQWELPETPDLSHLLDGGRLRVQQGVIAGCSGGMAQNIRAARSILNGAQLGNDAFSLSVYPASQPMMLALTRDGTLADLMASGATVRTAFCGPCFGAGDVPASGSFSIRHTTRNFPNREGSKPGQGQTAYTALMDARSIAATALNGGYLTAATQCAFEERVCDAEFDPSPYRARIYRGFGSPEPVELHFGPNITDWPKMSALPEDLTLTVAAAIYDEVTTTDELIPSGDTSSYRSNPLKLAEYTLSRKDPAYVGRCKALGYGSAVCALRPGDGSAREQAASCQRVLGGIANIALEYATKRYRSNLINWGMLPFIWPDLRQAHPVPGDTFALKGLRSALLAGQTKFEAIWTHAGEASSVTLELPDLTADERDVLLDGCLMNSYAKP